MHQNHKNLEDQEITDQQETYPQYVNEGMSSLEGSYTNLDKDYHRSSNSSTASSGKFLVQPSILSLDHKSHIDGLYGRLERGYNTNDEPRHSQYIYQTDLKRATDVYNTLSSPEGETRNNPMFFISPPSTPESRREHCRRIGVCHSTPPELLSTPETTSSNTSIHKLTKHNLQLHPQQFLSPPDKNSKISSIYDAYWHIPRPSLWCSHKGNLDVYRKCSRCHLQDDTSSTCSSVNPPPTFTAMDNYHPIRKRPNRCSCGPAFAITTIFCTFVLILIVAFIVYVEMVLKRIEYIPDRM